MNIEQKPTSNVEDLSSEEGLEHDVARAERMAYAEVPYREAILKKRQKKPYMDRIQRSKHDLRQEAWAEEAATQAGVNYDNDMSSGEHLVDSPEAEAIAYAARRGMERYLRYKKLRKATDIIIDNVVTNGGFEGLPRTTAFLHDHANRYFKTKAEKSKTKADRDAETVRENR